MRRALSLCYASAGLIVGACLSDSAPEQASPGVGGLGTGGSAGAQSGGEPPVEGGAGGKTLGGSAGSGSGNQPFAGAPNEAGASGEPPFALDPNRREIISVDGRVTGSSNGFGIDGTWSAFSATTATVTPNFAGLKVCVQGNYPKVPDSTKWPDYWGGGIGLNFRDDGKGGGLPYDAVAHGIVGLEMTIKGAKIPHELRLKYKAAGSLDNYCTAFFNVVSGDRVQVRVADVTRDCWNAGGAHIAPENLERFELHVWPELAGNVEMDLCLEDIVVLTTEEDAGGEGGAGGAAGGEAGAFGLGGAGGAN